MRVQVINARQINTKLRPKLAKVMRNASVKRSKAAKDTSISYYLLDGEAKKSYIDVLYLLEETLIGHDINIKSKYRLIKDYASDGDDEEEIQIFSISSKAITTFKDLLI